MTDLLQLDLHDDQRAFRPGEPVEGVISWTMNGRPKSAEVVLFWFTEGKGTRDTRIVDRMRIESPAPDDSHIFSLRLSDQPYSFSGTLISLQWAVEAILEPGHHVQRRVLTVSPTRKEIDLRKLATSMNEPRGADA